MVIYSPSENRAYHGNAPLFFMQFYSIVEGNAPITLKSYDSPTPRRTIPSKSLFGIQHLGRLRCRDWGRNGSISKTDLSSERCVLDEILKGIVSILHYLTSRITRLLCSSMSSDSTFFDRTFGIWNLLCPSSSCESTVFKAYEAEDLRLSLVI